MSHSSAASAGVATTLWPDRLQRALRGEGVRSVFQPIVDLSRRTVVGYEALTRFDSPDDQVFTPDQWFDAAHRHGVGAELDAVTLSSALALRADLPVNCFLTVNVDPDSLLADPVRQVFAAQGHLGGVVIEITEHRPWNWPALAPTVNQLRANGALFAVDDAGAGYSGLQQILQLRPSILKLDRALVEGIDQDEAKVALVEMLGMFANRVDAWVLAEGVETIGEARRLVELQVPLAQGYRFGRPEAPWVPIDESISAELADFTRAARNTLHRLVEPVAALNQGDSLAAGWLSTSDPWVAVLNADRRPIGLLNAEAALAGELIPALVANVQSTPQEVAHRMTTADREPSIPVLVIDNAGRYLGLITLRRLLGQLARDPGSTG